MKYFRLTWLAVTILTLLTCLGATIGSAQATNSGTVVGVVSDQSGAVVPDATVTLTDPSTNATRSTVTGHTGQYVFVNVSPGVYSITASKTGFESDKIASQTVQVGTQTTANFSLHVGNTQQTVEVQAAGTDLQTLNATIGGTVEQEAIAELPSLLHDAGTFTTLQVGVSPDGSVAGTVVDQSTFSLDGGNNTNDMDGSMSVYTGSFAGDPTGIANQNRNVAAGATGVLPTPADSVEEFKVNATGQTADFDNSAGAQVEIVTKRGTNKWHGTGYEYYLDNNFSANTWDNNVKGPGYAPPPDYHYSKYGFGGGGPIAPKFLGGKTYLFALYQGYRFPNSEVYERPVPSPNLENGLVTFAGTTYDLKALDPRHIGINPTVQQMWQKYEPAGIAGCPDINGSTCDGVNEYEFKGTLALPQKDNFLVGRLDHDFGDKWHFMTSYRYYKLTTTSTSQIDIGGFFTGDKLGQAASVASRPQQPWYYVAGLTTNITANLTNDFHYSFLRNYWSWSDKNAPPQVAGLGGALEPFGETASPLAPFNVNTQSVRTRFWDGQDQFLRDDLTLVKGSHLFNFGGQYQHNYNFHQRSDNGGGINFTPTYQLGQSGGTGASNLDLTALTNQGYPTGSKAARVAAAALGIVTAAQVAYTRSGPTLALNPPLTHAFDQSTIPYYNVYFSDTWHMKPSFTLSYGMGWTLEMPPTEANGKQTVLVDAADEPVKTLDYLAAKKNAALKGQVYNPELGFALVGNVGKGSKYPYNPFYGSFSPRIGVAWNPRFSDGPLSAIFGHENTVIRGGYGRIYGRLNGVDLVLVPLLGVGLIQPVQCTKALAPTSTSPATCGSVNPTISSAFRIGVDGDSAPIPPPTATLPQPVYPGYNNGASSAAEGLDPDFRPNVSDSFDITIQRQLNRNNTIEVGYIGRIIKHEYQPVDLNVVPYMMVQGGQNFANAYANLEKMLNCDKSTAACGAAGAPANVTPQAFFETALAGTGYCTGFASCTAAVMANEFGNLQTQAVWSLWSDLDNGFFNFNATQGPSMMNNGVVNNNVNHPAIASSGLALNASIGYGNYNGGFITMTTQNWHGLLMHNNFTYSKALGTGAFVQATSEYTPNDAFDLSKMYGVQAFNRKFVYNSYMVWQEPFFKGQQGILGRLAGGYSIAPIFTAGSGEPVYCDSQTDGQSFGAADANNYFSNEQCVFTTKYSGGASSHYGQAGGTDAFGNSVGTGTAGSGSRAVNMFKDPVAVWSQARAPILGIDSKNPGVGPIVGTPYWNVDMSLQKSLKVYESVALQFSVIFTNVFNHNILGDPAMTLYDSTTWGVQNTQTNTPRKMEFGGRVRF